MSHEMVAAVFRSSLRGTERLVALELADHHNRETGRCDPSIARICERTGLCDKTVRNALRKLAGSGVLRIDRTPGGSSAYVFIHLWKKLPDTPGKNYRPVKNYPSQNLPDPPGKIYRTPLEKFTGHPWKNLPVNQEGTRKEPGRNHEEPRARPREAAPANPPTLDQAKQAAVLAGVRPDVAEIWWNEHEASGWIDRHGRPVQSWRHSLTAFGRRWQANDASRTSRHDRERARREALYTQSDPELGF